MRARGETSSGHNARTSQWKKLILGNQQGAQPSKRWRATAPGFGRELAYVIDTKNSERVGEVVIALWSRTVGSKKGLWAPSILDDVLREQLRDPTDRWIVEFISGIREEGNGHNGHATGRFVLSRAVWTRVLPEMMRTGRCYVDTVFHETVGQTDDKDVAPLKWDGDKLWQFEIVISELEHLAQFEVRGLLRRGDETRPLIDTELVLGSGIVVWPDLGATIKITDATTWLSSLKEHPYIRVPDREKTELLSALYSLEHPPRLILPDALQFREEHITPTPFLRILDESSNETDDATGALRAEVGFLYEGITVHVGQSGRALIPPGSRHVVVRDFATEQDIERQLGELGFKSVPDFDPLADEFPEFSIVPSRLGRAVQILVDQGWHVEAEGHIYRQASDMKMEIRSNVDWFELHGEIMFGEQSISLPQLLKAIREDKNTIKLDDGSFGILPSAMTQRWGALVDLGHMQQSHLTFGKSQAAVLDAMLALQPEISYDDAFARMRQQLESGEGVKAIEQPEGFEGTLRDYQRTGLGWLQFLGQLGFGGCLADDMGLGKTVQVLALLASRKNEPTHCPSLVVAPRSLMFNWRNEAARFVPSLRVLEHTGTERRPLAEHAHDYDMIVTTYGTLRRDVAHMQEVTFDYVVLDEAQAIKNASTASSKAARLLKAKHRLALTGTPVENHLMELWALFEFLNPGMFGSVNQFRRVFSPKNPDSATHNHALIAKAIKPFLLRRTKGEVAKELPDRVEQSLLCDMDTNQRTLYNELREHYRASLMQQVSKFGIGKAKFHVLEALLRLRQAACHPGLIDKTRVGEPSAKLDTLMEQLTSVVEEGHKALVFSQFTSLLSIVRPQLETRNIQYEYLDGRTRDRRHRVERFQTDPDCGVFLISLKAGGLGLNLTAAEYVFLLDPWWNPAVEAQAIDRAHRIGQTRTVMAYRLICRDTVEEKITQLQAKKRALVQAIISTTPSETDTTILQDLTVEDIEVLLS